MSQRDSSISSRERVRLALAHQEADRVPIAMVCSGINPPADAEFDALLRERKGCDLKTYLDRSPGCARRRGPVYRSQTRAGDGYVGCA